MSKKCSIERNQKRQRMVENKKNSRMRLLKLIKCKATSFDDRLTAVHKLAEMPRNSSRVRVKNRCSLTGRSKGYYRKFGLSRIALRELASAGFLPGVTKASW